MTTSSVASEPIRALGAALPVATASLLAALLMALFNGAPTLTPILLVVASILMVATTLMESRGWHIVFRLAVQAITLAAAMWFLYQRGDVYAPQAALSVAGGLVVINVVSFASSTAENAGARRLPAVVALVGTLFMVFAALRLPNEGVLMLAIVAGMAAVLLWWRPLPCGAVFGAFAWALGFYAWLGNASGVAVAAPVLPALIGTFGVLAARIATRAGRSGLVSGSWWTKLNAWTLPGNSLHTTPLMITLATLASVLVAAAAWLLRLGDKPTLVGLAVIAVGYVVVLVARPRAS